MHSIKSVRLYKWTTPWSITLLYFIFYSSVLNTLMLRCSTPTDVLALGLKAHLVAYVTPSTAPLLGYSRSSKYIANLMKFTINCFTKGSSQNQTMNQILTPLNGFYKSFSTSNQKFLTKCLVEFLRKRSSKYWIEILLKY